MATVSPWVSGPGTFNYTPIPTLLFGTSTLISVGLHSLEIRHAHNEEMIERNQINPFSQFSSGHLKVSDICYLASGHYKCEARNNN